MIRLHHYPSTAAMVPHILLEELGVPYERIHVDRMADAHRRPEYLRLNPNGRIPVLEDGDEVLYETAAIVLHLAERHPRAGLLPPAATAARSQSYKWLAWLTNTLQATLMVYFYPERWMDAGNSAGAAELKRHAQAKVMEMLGQMDAHLAGHGGDWFLPDGYSALDAYAFTLCRWTRHFEANRARDHARLGPWLQRMLARPAVQRVIANEALQLPYV